jgi:hypothetical protein
MPTTVSPIQGPYGAASAAECARARHPQCAGPSAIPLGQALAPEAKRYSPRSDLGLRGGTRRICLYSCLRIPFGLLGVQPLLNSVTKVLVHIAPVLKGPLQDRLGHAFKQVSDDVV